MSEIIIINAGDTLPLDPTQSGLAHGFGLFETIKLVDGRLCFWEAHIARLLGSAQALDLSCDVGADELLEAIRELVRRVGISSGTVKISLLKNGSDTQLFVYTRPSMPSADLVRLHLDAAASPLNEHSVLAGHKTHNYMENMLLLQRARSAGYSDVIRVNTAGVLAETTVGNLFFIAGGQLSTPAPSTGILPGVIRREVLRAASPLSVSLKEGVYLPEQLQHADAVFITNSSVGILPVHAVECAAWQVDLDSGAHPMVQALSGALAVSEEQHSIQL
jgi:4-amino-4-deoxychorismate lyase